MKTLRQSILLLMLLLPISAFAQELQIFQETLPLLVEYATTNNPEIKSSEAKWRSYLNKTKQVSSLDDPMFMFKLQNLVAKEPWTFGGKDHQTAKVIGISQQLPYAGKLSIKKEIASYQADSYRWNIEERKLELARMVKETYYKIWLTDKSLEIIDKNIQIISDFITIAESKYSVGQGAQQDIYKGGLEKSKMLDLQITLKQQRRSLEANMIYLLANSENKAVGKIPDFDLPTVTDDPSKLIEKAYLNRPQIKSLISLANMGDASHRLASREFYPDFNLSFEYMFREAAMGDAGDNMFTIGVTFNLPFQQEKRHAMVAESSSETSMAMEELNALKNSISYTVNDSLAQLESRLKLVELYAGGIIPQAEQTLESAMIGYRVNKVDFLTLLDSRVNLFNYERQLYESKAEYMMQLARLEGAVGVELNQKR